jgi:hypothetical protein
MKNSVVSASILALGISLAGLFVFLGMRTYAAKDRQVAVKGLSTRKVKADHVVWPLSYAIVGDDLQAMYAHREKVSAQIVEMLKSKGFKAEDIQQGNISVDDKWNSYSENRPEFRYELSSSVVVSTDDVDRVKDNAGCQSELLNRGIIVNTHDWELDYQFNGLPELKPEMIEEATKNARAVAQKFADDADCRLGSISRASQGQFTVETDSYQPWFKHVRVVTTVDYMLE